MGKGIADSGLIVTAVAAILACLVSQINLGISLKLVETLLNIWANGASRATQTAG